MHPLAEMGIDPSFIFRVCHPYLDRVFPLPLSLFHTHSIHTLDTHTHLSICSIPSLLKLNKTTLSLSLSLSLHRCTTAILQLRSPTITSVDGQVAKLGVET